MDGCEKCHEAGHLPRPHRACTDAGEAVTRAEALQEARRRWGDNAEVSGVITAVCRCVGVQSESYWRGTGATYERAFADMLVWGSAEMLTDLGPLFKIHEITDGGLAGYALIVRQGALTGQLEVPIDPGQWVIAHIFPDKIFRASRSGDGGI